MTWLNIDTNLKNGTFDLETEKMFADHSRLAIEVYSQMLEERQQMGVLQVIHESYPVMRDQGGAAADGRAAGGDVVRIKELILPIMLSMLAILDLLQVVPC